jgi:hypothetical protein
MSLHHIETNTDTIRSVSHRHINRRPVKNLSDCPFQSCDVSTLRFFKVNSASPSSWAGLKLGLRLATERVGQPIFLLRRATGTVGPPFFRLRLAPPTIRDFCGLQERQVKTQKTGFNRCSASCLCKVYCWRHRIKYLFIL